MDIGAWRIAASFFNHLRASVHPTAPPRHDPSMTRHYIRAATNSTTCKPMDFNKTACKAALCYQMIHATIEGCMAYSRMHATSPSASSLTSPTRRGLGDATMWRSYSRPHPHGSPTPIRIGHNVQQKSSWKQICMHASKRGLDDLQSMHVLIN